MPGDVQLGAEGEERRQEEGRDQEAAARRAPAAPSEPADDDERRGPEERAVLGVVPGEVARDRVRPARPRQLALGRDEEVDEVGDVRLRRHVGRGVQGLRGVEQERRGDDAGGDVGEDDRADRAAQPWSALGHEPECEQQRAGEREREREDELGREQQLQREQRGEAQDEAAAVELALDVAQDDERDQRHEEHGRHVDVPLEVAVHVAREAEQVAADERGPERPRQVPAEQERRPGGQHRHQDRDHVVGRERADQQRQRRHEHREADCGRRPRQVDADRRPEGRRDQRVVPVQDRVREPAERPDHDLRVVERADVLVSRLDQQAQPEVEQRQGGERGEGGGARPVAAGHARSGCRRRRNADQSRSRAAAASSASTKSHGTR